MERKQILAHFFQLNPRHVVFRRQYSPSSLTSAYMAVKENDMSVYKAAKVYKVPQQTLRDRVIGKVDIDTTSSGRNPVLSLSEEEKLVSHLEVMAKYGYGYIRQEVCDIATDYAVQLGKRCRDDPFTLNWFRKFVKRWPQLRVLQPRGLENVRAKSTSSLVVSSYFKELEQTLDKYGLRDKPHLIFNIDEKGVMQNHTPPAVVAGTDFHPPAVVSQKGQTTTIIGCGNASGMAVPPFFVFAGKRLIPDLLKGASPGADGMMSDSGWVNADVFRHYMKEHLTKFLPHRDAGQHVLIVLDGHKSHISLDLVEWAKQQNIVLFILPAHTSHILQPLDVGCFGPFQRMFNSTCHRFIRDTSATITRYNICELSCKVYSKALSAENLHSAFKRSGIYPLDSTAINQDSLIPAEVFCSDEMCDVREPNGTDSEIISEVSEVNCNTNENVIEEEGRDQVSSQKAARDFLDSKVKKLFEVKRKSENSIKKRRNISEIIAGKAITESAIQSKMINFVEESTSIRSGNKALGKTNIKSSKKCMESKSKSVKVLKKSKKSSSNKAVDSPKPGPSHIYLSDSSQSLDEDEMPESEKCCVCKLYEPKELRQCNSLIFVKWAECTRCAHWVHLIFCSEKRVVRKGEPFYCIHCSPNTEE